MSAVRRTITVWDVDTLPYPGSCWRLKADRLVQLVIEGASYRLMPDGAIIADGGVIWYRRQDQHRRDMQAAKIDDWYANMEIS